ncbi:hypothetical protein GUJ93_ZPchr0013g35182 [Zizania palustris]|uniref:Uncharacterized protein n=1 Tax=Zizania palustris TaxID=103762 RepID=A0A8J5X0D8_ZIZPA|nr:hypothetical protein GUJ93_ZPchr0013g35182 [Zizania palustris]
MYEVLQDPMILPHGASKGTSRVNEALAALESPSSPGVVVPMDTSTPIDAPAPVAGAIPADAAPLTEHRTGLWALLEPLAEKIQDIANSDLVSALSEARAPGLNMALERAALQQFVLARAAATSNEVETNRLKRKVTTLQTALKDSDERALRLEEEVLVERRARVEANEALRLARQASNALRTSAQEAEAESLVLRAEVEKLRLAAATLSTQLVELQGSLKLAMAQKNSLMLQVVEVSATAAELETAEKKNASVEERTLDALQGTLEYFGTKCPSSSAAANESLDRKLKRIQVAVLLMMNSGVRYGEISGQCARIGVLCHLEALQIPIALVGGSTPGSFASEDLLHPSTNVASAWEVFRSTWKTDHKAAAKAWIDEARRQKQAQTRPPLLASPALAPPAPPTDPQVLSCSSEPDFEILDFDEGLRKEWASLESLSPYCRSHFSVPRGDKGEVTLEVFQEVLAYIKEEEKEKAYSSSEHMDWSDSEYQADDPAAADSKILLTWAELQEEQKKLRASKNKRSARTKRTTPVASSSEGQSSRRDPNKQVPRIRRLATFGSFTDTSRLEAGNLFFLKSLDSSMDPNKPEPGIRRLAAKPSNPWFVGCCSGLGKDA